MRISSLRYFYEVAELKSISKVSNNLHISQPALSHQLSKLEKELGVKLFERSNRGVELTDKGEILYNYAKEILNLHRNLVADIDEDTNIKQEINIDILNVHSNFLMKNVVKDINKIFKNSNININNKREINDKALLLHNRADVLLGCDKIEDTDLVCNYIGSDKLVLVGQSHVECKERSKLEIALLGDNSNIDSNDLEKLDKMNICLKTDSLDIIKSYLRNPNVAAIVPQIAVEKELNSGELVILCSNAYAIKYNFYITYKKNIDLNLRKKIRILKEELEIVLNKVSINMVI